MSKTSWPLWLHEHVWARVLNAKYRLETGGREGERAGGDTRAEKMEARLRRSGSFCLPPEKLNHRLDFFFFFYKQEADCSPGAPQAKNPSVSSGSYTTMIKIRLIRLSLLTLLLDRLMAAVLKMCCMNNVFLQLLFLQLLCGSKIQKENHPLLSLIIRRFRAELHNCTQVNTANT